MKSLEDVSLFGLNLKQFMNLDGFSQEVV